MENLLEVPYLDGFDDVADINREFSNTRYDEDFNELPSERHLSESETVLIAVYTYECYSGKAFVLYEQDGKLFEVNGGHCSCYGLEDQFDPEETTWEALLMRDFSDSWYSDYNPWNSMNDRIAALAAERGVFPKGEQA